MRNWILPAMLVLLLPAQSIAYTPQELNAQLELLMEWWPGEYDNNEQIVRQSGGGLSVPVYTPHFRIHAHYVPLKLDAVGNHVLYVEEYKNNDPTELYRIRLLSLSVDEAANGIRLVLYRFADQAAWQGAHASPERLAKISTDDVIPLSEGCEVSLSYEGDRFRGRMKDRACTMAVGGSREKNAWFEYRIVVGPDRYWFKDKARLLTDNSVAWELAPGSEDFFQASRAQSFSCVVNYNVDGDMTRTEKLTTVSLHDQGGEAAIEYPGGRNLSLVLHRREFSVPSERTFRILRLHEDQHHVPLSYTYADSAADRFGMNFGWFYTLCQQAD